MVASYCARDSRADRAALDVAAIVPSQGGPTEKKEPCDWCDGDR